MTTINRWKAAFQTWPNQIPRRGVLVNAQGETFPFKGFMVADEMVLLERTNPDTLGARFVMLAYDTIVCVKFVDPLPGEAFATFGFEGKLSS